MAFKDSAGHSVDFGDYVKHGDRIGRVASITQKPSGVSVTITTISLDGGCFVEREVIPEPTTLTFIATSDGKVK